MKMESREKFQHSMTIHQGRVLRRAGNYSSLWRRATEVPIGSWRRTREALSRDDECH